MTLKKWLIGTILLAGVLDTLVVSVGEASAADVLRWGLRRRRPQPVATSTTALTRLQQHSEFCSWKLAVSWGEKWCWVTCMVP
jgi:hypothetical protein